MSYFTDISGTPKNNNKWSDLNISYTFEKAFYYTNQHDIQKDFKNSISGDVTKTNTAVAVLALKEWSSVVNFKFTQATDYKQAKLAILGAQNITAGPFGGYEQGDQINNSYRAVFIKPEVNMFKELFMHEIGHALGLDHPGHAGGGDKNYNRDLTIMSYNIGTITNDTSLTVNSPMIYDIATIQQLYGSANINYDTAGFTNIVLSGNNELRTIWDAGGYDTLDASKVTTASIGRMDLIDLRITDSSHINFSHVGKEYFNLALDPVTKWTKSIQIESAKAALGNSTHIIGNDDSNTLIGGNLNDTLEGGNGSDYLVGGAGNDSLIGGSGNNYIDGGIGNDTLEGSSGDDTLVGGANNDVLIGGGGQNKIDGGDGNDRLVGGSGNDELLGGKDNDTIVGGDGHNYIDGGAGIDAADYGAVTSNIDVRWGYLSLYSANVEYKGGKVYDTLYGIEKIILGSKNDNIEFWSIYQNITVDGGAESDLIRFQLDAKLKVNMFTHNISVAENTINFSNIESIQGGYNDDIFYVNNSINHFQGRDGIDTLDLSQSKTGVVVNAPKGGSMTAYGFEIYKGSAYNDYIGNMYGKVFDGAGNDTIIGGVYSVCTFISSPDNASDLYICSGYGNNFVFDGNFGIDTIKDIYSGDEVLINGVNLARISFTQVGHSSTYKSGNISLVVDSAHDKISVDLGGSNNSIHLEGAIYSGYFDDLNIV